MPIGLVGGSFLTSVDLSCLQFGTGLGSDRSERNHSCLYHVSPSLYLPRAHARTTTLLSRTLYLVKSISSTHRHTPHIHIPTCLLQQLRLFLHLDQEHTPSRKRNDQVLVPAKPGKDASTNRLTLHHLHHLSLFNSRLSLQLSRSLGRPHFLHTHPSFSNRLYS